MWSSFNYPNLWGLLTKLINICGDGVLLRRLNDKFDKKQKVWLCVRLSSIYSLTNITCSCIPAFKRHCSSRYQTWEYSVYETNKRLKPDF